MDDTFTDALCQDMPDKARFAGLRRRWLEESARLARSGRGVFLFLVRASFAGMARELTRGASPCDLVEEAGSNAAGLLMPDMEPLEAERRALALHARITSLAGAPVTAAYGLVRREPEQLLRGGAMEGFFAKVLKVLNERPLDGGLHRVREDVGTVLGTRVLAEEKRFLLFGAR